VPDDAPLTGPPGPVTLWEVSANRWWPTIPVLYAVGGIALTVLLGVLTRLDPWSLLALLFVPYGLASVPAARARVRLTPDAVEVRGLRTTRFRYADIASVEVSPAWAGARSVWIRLEGSWPQAAPEVLSPPPEWWHVPGRSLADVVAAVQARTDAAHGRDPNPDPPV
jgi:hypothetical protein